MLVLKRPECLPDPPAYCPDAVGLEVGGIEELPSASTKVEGIRGARAEELLAFPYTSLDGCFLFLRARGTSSSLRRGS